TSRGVERWPVVPSHLMVTTSKLLPAGPMTKTYQGLGCQVEKTLFFRPLVAGPKMHLLGLEIKTPSLHGCDSHEIPSGAFQGLLA
ncbi:MAG: hypothetical protein U1D69_15415, partial [Polynucleobacter sp.]|nr:hypothetical protein [Polynucleobacter sp.]